MVVEGWFGRGSTTLHCTHHALPHHLRHQSFLSLFSFVRLHISMEGCYRRVLIWGILVSRHIGRCFPDAFKIRKKTSPSMVESAAECSLTLQGGAELGHDEVQRTLEGFPSSVCDPVFCAGSGNPYDGNRRRHCGCVPQS